MRTYPSMNYDEFNRVTKILREAGHIVINPAEDSVKDPFYGTPNWTWKYALSKDVKKIIDKKVDSIVLLPGWQISTGAKVEIFITTVLCSANIYLYRETVWENDEITFELNPVKFTFDMNMQIPV